MSAQGASASRLFYTLRHLRWVQIAARAKRVVNKKLPQRIPLDTPLLLAEPGQFIEPALCSQKMLAPDQFMFLNYVGEVRHPADWNSQAHNKLWLYNLHYFDDLNSVNGESRSFWHRELLSRWVVENPAAFGNGWEPYPISLRIVNWIKWHLSRDALDNQCLRSLAQQARQLQRNVEWHLLGNHLFANAKALVFAGLFFKGEEAKTWLGSGIAILSQEIPEQILPDGGHFELSPMYHATILEDVLDLINIGRCYNLNWSQFNLEKTAKSMISFLGAMTHLDGNLGFFNDSVTNIAKTNYDLCRYAKRLDTEPDKSGELHSILFPDSGYARLVIGEAHLIADVGDVGPRYNPGHAHADTLSFEFSLGQERVVVNSGISTYERGAQRQFERGTAAHSTVEIDGENSSDVWAAFRVGRRAKARVLNFDSKVGAVTLEAEHDGYAHLTEKNIVSRNWKLGLQALDIRDVITKPFNKAVARFFLAPQCELSVSNDGKSGMIVTRLGRKIYWESSLVARSEASSYYPSLGKIEPSHCLVADIIGQAFHLTLKW